MPQIGIRPPEPLLTPGSSVDWLDLVHVLCRQPQLLWVHHMCNGPIIFRRCCSPGVLSGYWLLQCPLLGCFWALRGGDVEHLTWSWWSVECQSPWTQYMPFPLLWVAHQNSMVRLNCWRHYVLWSLNMEKSLCYWPESFFSCCLAFMTLEGSMETAWGETSFCLFYLIVCIKHLWCYRVTHSLHSNATSVLNVSYDRKRKYPELQRKFPACSMLPNL